MKKFGTVNLNLREVAHKLALLFLALLLFMPYQIRWFSAAPQTAILLLGVVVSVGALLQSGRWRKIRLDWPLLLLMGCLMVSVLYHQAFNIHARAYVLSIAAYLWLRHSLRFKDLPQLTRIGILFLGLQFLLLLAQLWLSEWWFVARYFTSLDSFRIPLGFFDIPTTAAFVPAVVLLFLFVMRAQDRIAPSWLLNLCFFVTPLTILAPVSRSAIVSFFCSLFLSLILNQASWRRMIRPTVLILIGFMVFTMVLYKSQDQLAVGGVFEYKVVRPMNMVSAFFTGPSGPSKVDSSGPSKVDSSGPSKVDSSGPPWADSSVTSRIVLWKAIISLMVANPQLLLQGIGIGQSEIAFKHMLDNGTFDRKVFGNSIISPHNSFIELFYEGGVIVELAFLIFLASRLLSDQNWKSPWFGAWVSLVFFMLFYDLLRMRYFWIALALVEVYRYRPSVAGTQPRPESSSDSAVTKNGAP